MPKIPRKTPVKETATVNTAACVNCGTLLTDDQKYVSEGRSYCATCAILPRKQEPALAAPAGLLKWLCYLVAFFSPLAGFVLGVVFFLQKDNESRSFGRHCFIVVAISLIIIVLFLVVSAVIGMLTGAGNSGVNIGEGYY